MTSAPNHVSITDEETIAAMEAALAAIIDVTERFEARKVITQAKELLMTHRKMTEPEAYRWIQKTAMDRRSPMVSIAKTIIESFGSDAGDQLTRVDALAFGEPCCDDRHHPAVQLHRPGRIPRLRALHPSRSPRSTAAPAGHAARRPAEPPPISRPARR